MPVLSTEDRRLLVDNERRQVRHCVRRDGPLAELVFSLAAGDRVRFTVNEWRALTRELDRCEDTLADWVAKRESKPQT